MPTRPPRARPSRRPVPPPRRPDPLLEIRLLARTQPQTVAAEAAKHGGVIELVLGVALCVLERGDGHAGQRLQHALYILHIVALRGVGRGRGVEEALVAQLGGTRGERLQGLGAVGVVVVEKGGAGGGRVRVGDGGEGI